MSAARPATGTAMSKEIEALRALLDARLAALEAALADPSQVESLEQLLFDLARVATEEADATVRKAYADAQREAQNATAAVRAEWQAALEVEKAAAAELRRDIERAQAVIHSERLAVTAKDRELETAREALQREQGTKDDLRREFEEARRSFDAEAARATLALREEFQQAQAAVRREHEAAQAALRGEIEQARAALQAEQAATAAVGHELEAAQLALEAAQHGRADLARQVEAARTATAAAGRELEAARLALDQEQATTAALRRDLEAARAAPTTEPQAPPDDGRSDEWQDLTGDLETVRQAAATAEAEGRARYEQLRDATEQQIRTLELALREADNRAEMAALELEELRRELKAPGKDARRGPEPAAVPEAARAATPPPPAPGPVAAYDGPERQASRYTMATEIDIQIDGSRAWLVDLSLTGAQVLSSGPLKPNRVVRLTLPAGEATISCKGKIVWARIDSSRAGQLLYRAGVLFTAADQASLSTFISRFGTG